MKRPEYSAAKKRSIAARVVRQLGEIREASPAAYRTLMVEVEDIMRRAAAAARA